jgi:hypothetical protein
MEDYSSDWEFWIAIAAFFLALLVIGILMQCRKEERATLALKQQNGAYPTAVQAAQGVQVQVPIPVAEAVPVSEQPGVASATATPNRSMNTLDLHRYLFS